MEGSGMSHNAEPEGINEVLPKELLGVIIDFLDEISIVIAHSVCKLWNSLIAPSKLLPPSSSSSSTSMDWEYVRRLPRWSPCGLPTAMAQCGRVELIQWAVDDGWKLSVDDVVRRAAFGGNVPVLQWVMNSNTGMNVNKVPPLEAIEAALEGGHFKEFMEVLDLNSMPRGRYADWGYQNLLEIVVKNSAGAYRIEALEYCQQIVDMDGARRILWLDFIEQKGDRDLWTWFLDHGFFESEDFEGHRSRGVEFCSAAIEGDVGRLELLSSLSPPIFNGWERLVFQGALSQGQVRCLEWLEQKWDLREGILAIQDAFGDLIRGGHLQMMKWLQDKQSLRWAHYTSEKHLEIAIVSDKWEILDFLVCDPRTATMLYEMAAGNGDLDVLKWLKEKKAHLVNWNSQEVCEHVMREHVRLLLACVNEYAGMRPWYPLGNKIGQPFRREQHLEVLSWLVSIDGSGILTTTCLAAVLQLKEEKLMDRYVRWLKKVGAPWNPATFHEIVDFHDVPLGALKWLMESGLLREE